MSTQEAIDHVLTKLLDARAAAENAYVSTSRLDDDDERDVDGHLVEARDCIARAIATLNDLEATDEEDEDLS